MPSTAQFLLVLFNRQAYVIQLFIHLASPMQRSPLHESDFYLSTLRIRNAIRQANSSLFQKVQAVFHSFHNDLCVVCAREPLSIHIAETPCWESELFYLKSRFFTLYDIAVAFSHCFTKPTACHLDSWQTAGIPDQHCLQLWQVESFAQYGYIGEYLYPAKHKRIEQGIFIALGANHLTGYASLQQPVFEEATFLHSSEKSYPST